jgi:heme-degrading monooxygenase HmoA
MLGRAVIAQGDPAKVDEVVAFVRDRVQPLVDSLPGSHGLGMWANRETGMIVVNSAWEDEAALLASNEQLASLRSEALKLLGAPEARIEVLEPAVMFQNEPDQPGYWSRATETRAPVERMDENIALFTSEVLPAIREIPGFNTIALLVNRDEGRMVANVTYSSREELDASRERAATLREASVTRLGAKVTGVMELEVAIVGIRPGIDLPSQSAPVEFPAGRVTGQAAGDRASR